jgi:anti-anti-sigma factor
MILREIETTDKLIVLALDGSLDLTGTREISTSIFDKIGAGTKAVIMDFSRVTFIASFGLRMLIDVVKSLEFGQQKLVVLKPQPNVEKTLIQAGLDNIAIISHDETDARTRAVSG